MKTRLGTNVTPKHLRTSRIPISGKAKKLLQFDQHPLIFQPDETASQINKTLIEGEPSSLLKNIETNTMIGQTDNELFETAKNVLPTKSNSTLRTLFLSQKTTYFWTRIILVAEVILCIAIITKIKYTEIDWSTYMQQVTCFLNGTRDYSKITGDTGPIVYPAGHLYFYTLFFIVTDGGFKIQLAQYIFAFIYLVNATLILKIYQSTRVNVKPIILLVMFFGAYRVHSIFVLRMFNDPIAMMFMHAAILCLVKHRYSCSSVLFSLAVSVKMNVVLFAPAWASILLAQIGLAHSILQGLLFLSVQIVLGAPFIASHPLEYLKCAFNLGRVFMYKWTVNWRFVPEHVFLDRRFHALLMSLHILVLCLFAYETWFRQMGGQGIWQALYEKRGRVLVFPQEAVFALWTANLAGIAFARSLHYQFYSWYYYSIPYLLAHTGLSWPLHIAVMICLEVSWNTYPSKWWSSALLNIMHLIIITALLVKYRCRRLTVKNDY